MLGDKTLGGAKSAVTSFSRLCLFNFKTMKTSITKTLQLIHSQDMDGRPTPPIYYFHGRFALCSQFVKKLLGVTPKVVKVTVSTRYLRGATKIFVRSDGNWGWNEKRITRSRMEGMYRLARITIQYLFDGFDTRPVYVKVVKVS